MGMAKKNDLLISNIDKLKQTNLEDISYDNLLQYYKNNFAVNPSS